MIPRRIREIILENAKRDLQYFQSAEADERFENWRRLVPSQRQKTLPEMKLLAVGLDHAEAGEVKYEPARWIDRRLSGRERMQFSRELEKMESEGLIERRGGRSTTYIVLKGEQ